MRSVESPLLGGGWNGKWYWAFLFIGVTLLWPWNCIISASVYFQDATPLHGTVWSGIFTSSAMSTSTLTSCLFNYWLSLRQHSYHSRILNGLMWQAANFMLLSLIPLFGNSIWCPPFVLFTYIIGLNVCSSMATALTQNGIMAMANATNNPAYTQGVMMGQAVAGVLPSIVLLSLAFEHRDTTINQSLIFVYFTTTVVISIYGVYLYKRHIPTIPQPIQDRERHAIPFHNLFYKLRYLVLSIFITYTISLIFPVFAATVPPKALPLTNYQFSPLVFTIWNIGDLYGRTLTHSLLALRPSNIFWYSCARLVFPLLLQLLSKAAPTLSTDILYISAQFLFGVTNGQVTSLSYIQIPSLLSTTQEKEAAGGFTNIFLSAGLLCGSLLSYPFAT